MTTHTADTRRARGQPGYRAMPRREYVQRAREYAPRIPKRLTADDVLEIRANRRGLTDRQQGEIYGVHENTIFRVRRRETWAHVE